MLADDEDEDSGCAGVRVRVGAAFLHTAKEEAEARVEELTGIAKERLAGLEGEADGVGARLSELKAALYARLGTGNINLEE